MIHELWLDALKQLAARLGIPYETIDVLLVRPRRESAITQRRDDVIGGVPLDPRFARRAVAPLAVRVAQRA